jgi:hypothetical protein
MMNVRLVMSPTFLNFEYTPEPGRFLRLHAGRSLAVSPYAIDYLLNGEDITFLGDLKFDNGTSLLARVSCATCAT